MTEGPTPRRLTAQPTRLVGIDALRGLAVVLMLEQHLGVWLWRLPTSRLRAALPKHPFMVGLNSLGGLAAPIFITLAGVGVTLFVAQSERHGGLDRRLVSRGCAILLMGYALNLVTPFWFSPGSWYVLHLIGLCLVISPLLRRTADGWLMVILVAALAAAVLLQYLLETPAVLSNRRLRDLSLAGGHLRLALVEGNFPVFPWLAFFVAGVLAGRRALDGRMRRVAAAACVAGAGALAGLVGGKVLGASALALSSRLYPLRLPTLLALMSAVLFAVVLFVWLGAEGPRAVAARLPVSPKGPKSIAAMARAALRSSLLRSTSRRLVDLGRTSLSLFVFHVFVFKQLSHTLGLYKRLDAAPALAAIVAIIATLAAFSWWWGRHGYAYGAEWLVRRLDGVVRVR